MDTLKVLKFDCDRGNIIKCRRHGVSTDEIERLFAGVPLALADIAHSALEDRLIAVGDVPGGRPIFVAFTHRIVRRDRLIRPFSARYMHAKEFERYVNTRSRL